jgi:DNA polymerase (family 10)
MDGVKYYTNLEIAELLRKMAAAYQILDENRFKIIAYERAADSIEHLTSEVKDLWDDEKLSEIPGVGPAIVGHLDELFRTGKVRHFESVMTKVPQSVFPLLSVPGIGPKKAYKLVKELHLQNEKNAVQDLEKAIHAHKIAPIVGFGEKSEDDILQNIKTYHKGAVKEKRILLFEADHIADDVIKFLTKDQGVKRVDALGSLRRKVATVGDIDIAIMTDKPKEAIAYFCTYPHKKIIEQGPTGASLLLHNGRQVDLRVQEEASYGAMLQYFTGSKNHNIALRTYALTKGLSLSEYGIKKMNNKGKIIQFDSEDAFYRYLGMANIPPELREDRGEIATALKHEIPLLVETNDIRGDMHLHTSFDLEPSHDLGANTIHEVLDVAKDLGYRYIGISDHNPSIGNHTDKEIVTIMKNRQEFYQKEADQWRKKNNSDLQIFIMLEVDIKPDGSLALPKQAFEYVDGVIASVHSSFSMKKADMTKRLLSALTAHPKVKMLGHPTGRLLGKREGYEADWHEIFTLCKEHDIALEINASPYRLDLPDALVYDAVKLGCRFSVNTDAHSVSEMEMMKYGVSVARRGWAEKRDILNTYSYNDIRKWLESW